MRRGWRTKGEPVKTTNIFGLPETIARAARKRNAMYNSNADRSTTQLIAPPRIDVLRKAHHAEIEKDLSEEIFALLGSAVHYILELGADDNKETAEERLYARINGWVISGQVDLQHDPADDGWHLKDYKVTAAYSVKADRKPDWEAQLNIYAYLVWLNHGIRVSSIAICAIVRDWQRREAAIDLSYPQAPIVLVPQQLWSVEEQEAYIRSRVELHQQAVLNYDLGEELPECTHEERWAKPDKWYVLKVGNKRGKTFASQEEAAAFIESQKGDFTMELRPGRSMRCDFCGVQKWCSQYARMVQEDEGNDNE